MAVPSQSSSSTRVPIAQKRGAIGIAPHCIPHATIHAYPSSSGKMMDEAPLVPDGLRMEVCSTEVHSKGRKNCAYNPLCVWGLGESSKKGVVWGGDSGLIDTLGRNPGLLSRNEKPAGLKNMGATCYLGSLLQLLYTSSAFRRALYGCDQEGEVSGCLEKILADMEFGNRASCEVSILTTLLGLDPNEQQDAQEFGKLFAHRLEEERPSCIEPIFRGKVENRTTCSSCGCASTQVEALDEVECIVSKGSSVAACVAAQQEPETMSGDNSYFCDHCNTKRAAERRSTVIEPPRKCLLVQLLRYVYDTKTWEKKKLKTNIELSPTLELCGVLFYLKAVVYHRGESANGGHYVAHAQRENGQWYEFDDDNVTRICAAASQHYKRPTQAAPNSKKKAALTTSSKGEAYMLLYTRADDDEKAQPGRRPSPQAADYVARLDDRHRAACAAYTAKQEMLALRIAKRQEMYTEYFGTGRSPAAEVSDDGEPCGQYVLLETSVLQAWVNGDDLVQPDSVVWLTEDALLCAHDKLRPDKLGKFKCLKPVVYDAVVKDLPRSTRRTLTQRDALCRACLTAKRAANAAQRETDQLRIALYDDLKLALRQQHDDDSIIEEDELYLISLAWYHQLSKRQCRSSASKRKKPLNENATADLECEHGGLSPSASRFAVDETVWRKVCKLYAASKALRASTKVCVHCAATRDAAKLEDDAKKRQLRAAPQLRGLLDRLDLDVDDPLGAQAATFLKPVDIDGGLRLVRRDWLARWRGYHRSSKAAPPPMGDQVVRCEAHGLKRLPTWVACVVSGSGDADSRAFAVKRAIDQARTVDDLIEAGLEDMSGAVDIVSEAEYEALNAEYPGKAPALEEGWCETCLEADLNALEEERTRFKAEPIRFAPNENGSSRRRWPRRTGCSPVDVLSSSSHPLGLVLLKLLEAWDLPAETAIRNVYDLKDQPLRRELQASLEQLGVKACATLRVEMTADHAGGEAWTIVRLAECFADCRDDVAKPPAKKHKYDPEKGFEGTLLLSGRAIPTPDTKQTRACETADYEASARDNQEVEPRRLTPERNHSDDELHDALKCHLDDMGYDTKAQTVAVALEDARLTHTDRDDILNQVVAILDPESPVGLNNGHSNRRSTRRKCA